MATRRLVPAVTLVAALVTTVHLWPCSHGHYEAAPTLSNYPERHPIKTMRELLALSMPELPAPPDAPTVDDVIGKILTAPRSEALRTIDEALSTNRRHNYEARVANLWWDLRDLIQVSGENGLSPEAQAYIHWRRDRMLQEKRGLPPRREEADTAAANLWWYNEVERRAQAEKLAAAKTQYDADALEMETLMASAPRPLLPHYMVQRGGMAFRRGHLKDAARWFSAVCWSQPTHPRAEAAHFMLARTRLEQARQAKSRWSRESVFPMFQDPFWTDASLLLAQYNHRYPRGRYQAEVLGWEGALYSMGDLPWRALQCYVQQLDRAEQPEVVQSAGREIERCLRACLELDAEEDAADATVLEDIAKRPVAAMRVMNYLLDGAAVVDYGRWPYSSEAYSEPEVIHNIATRLARSRSPKLLSQLAAAVAGNQQSYERSEWQPGFLAILAWAASEQGEHAQAIRLCERTPALLAASDDLQYCRAVVLQRLGQEGEALKALRTLQTQFPESRLTKELDLRMAKCLHALHRDGEAIVGLAQVRNTHQEVERLVSSDPPAASTNPLELHRDSELAQYQDVLEAFAPIEQLEIAVRSPELPADEAKRMRSLLLARLVVAERWADVDRVAALIIENNTDGDMFWDDSYGRGEPTAIGKVELARTLAGFHAPLAQTPGDAWEQAVRCWSLAHLWEAARGMISLESLGSGGWDYMHSDYRRATLQLRANALALGYDPVVVYAGLDAQDELRHTYEYCLRTASLAPQSPLAAKALHKALECLKRMAEASPYAQARAFEQDWSTLSRQLYDRLQREHPDSPEAKTLAAWWTFPSPAEARDWMPGNRSPWIEDYQVVFALKGGRWGSGPYYQAQLDSQEEYAKDQQLGVLWPRVLNLSGLGAQGEAHRVLEESASIRTALMPIGGTLEPYGNTSSWYQAMNALDDAELIARLSPERLPHLAAYFARFFLTYGEMAPQPEPDDAANPLADFIAYRLILRGPVPFESWEKRAEQWQQYLAERPHSLKTEAAEFQLARATTRQYRDWASVDNHAWPEAPFKGEYVRLVVTGEKPFEATAVFDALDRYEKQYPQGRYLADIHLMRGAASIDAGDYPTALRLLCGILKDENHRELHLDAALNLAQCFELLHAPATRLSVAKAIANDPEALQRFRLFAHSLTCGHRLQVMVNYVESMKK